ncbi:polyadenylate-binding protein 4-like isoform 3 [Leptotrombidium deliense]|uniref:Polyadenylate-binding protein 4-like isoform 3 n=1 Tax=Leptotrombidium deliense TaxID=299467 RepID=A0A443S6M6_9ACAR|nr:polyadenylate-binding protein 4-like isoform 3 [Leptotrombidium deliense]
MDFAGVSKKRLYLSNTIEEMNCMVEKKLKDIDSKTLREYSIRNDFVSAQQAMRIGDEELAYVLYSLAIHRFVHLRDYITKVDFSDSEQDECIRRLDELSKSLIKRYNEQIVGLINTPTSSQQKPANKIIITAMHNPKSPSIFAKIKRFFSGKSENTVKYTSVETGIEALNLTQRLTSTRGNGEDESQKMILTLQEYKNRLAEIRRGVETKKRKEATSEHENQKQQAKINELTKFKPTSSKFNNQTKNIHSVSEVKHNKLNFSGFPPQCTEEYVRKLFNTYGQITKFIPSKLANGQFGGFGEIEYKTREAAEKAVKSMSGVIITGKRISVSFNEPNNHQVNKPVVDYTNIHPLIKIVPKSPQEIDKPADNRRRDRSSNRKEEKADNRVLFVKFSTEDISSEEKLRSLFARFGNIRYANIGRNANGSKTNFGKVCFFNAEHTNSAILEMNNYTFHSGKKLSVSRYRFNTAITDQAPNDTKQAKKQSHSISNESDFTNIYVKNFKDLYRNERELSEAFLKFGAIKSARVMRDNKNESLGWGFVCFYNHFNAKTAVEQMNNTVINDHRLFVRRAYNKYDKKKILRNQFSEQRTNKIRASKYSGAKSKVKHTCIVCFTENLSAESSTLDCQHVICKECIVLYIQHFIDNKEVESIICPKDGSSHTKNDSVTFAERIRQMFG